MKVIFLDFDGVLNSSTSLFVGTWIDQYKDDNSITERQNTDMFMARPDPLCVDLLDFLIDKTNAHIVVSSSWRLSKDIDELKWTLKNAFKLRNWDKVIGKTKHTDYGESRGDQIECYSKDNITHYLILDDDSDMLDSQKQNFVNTDYRYGLRLENMEDCFKILGCDFRGELK